MMIMRQHCNEAMFKVLKAKLEKIRDDFISKDLEVISHPESVKRRRR